MISSGTCAGCSVVERQILKLPLDRMEYPNGEPQRRIDLQRPSPRPSPSASALAAPSIVLMLCSLSASLIKMTLTSLWPSPPSSCGSSRPGPRPARLELDLGQLRNTCSTIFAISSPEPGLDLPPIDAVVSSTVSCSSAAHSVSVSSLMPAQIPRDPDRMHDEVLARLPAPADRHGARTRTRTRPARVPRSISTAESAACSETIANRSASSRRSSSVRSSGGGGRTEARSGCLASTAVVLPCDSEGNAMIKG